MAKTPKIRFKNFSDEWENKFLWEISSNIYQPQTIQETDFTKFGYDVYGANGIIGKYHSYNHELAQIAIACRGNSCGIVNLTKNKVWITGNAMVVNVDSIKNINKIFLYFLLYQTDFSYLITGSGQPQITGNIKNHQCNLPKNLKEQEKIGAFFSKLDKLISLHQSKFEKLQKIKKSCLQNLFPQNNQNTPKIRFKNFSDEWVENVLNKMAYFSKGYGYSKSDLVDRGSPIILYGRLYTNYQTTIKNVDTFVKPKKILFSALAEKLLSLHLAKQQKI